MRVEVTRSGGYAGFSTRASLDTTSLEPGEREAVDETLKRTIATPPESVPAPDRFQYDLAITDDDDTHHVTLHEPLPEDLRGLMTTIMARPEGPP